MHKHSYRLTAAALLLLSGVSAQACEIWRDEDFGIWRANCNLAEDFRNKVMLSHSFLANYDHKIIDFKWPDLHIRKFKFTVVGGSVDIEADIENLGRGNAVASQLAVDVSIGDPLTGTQYSGPMTFMVTVPALSANSSRRVSVGSVGVPNGTQDWDLVLLGVTDPPTMAQPVRGLIIESDETNNVTNHACRWFGPTPDTSLQACN